MLAADNYITSFTAEETLLPYNNQLYKHIYQQELAQKENYLYSAWNDYSQYIAIFK